MTARQIVLVAMAALPALAVAAAQDRPGSDTPSPPSAGLPRDDGAGWEMSAEQRAAIDRGLEFLARNQSERGAWLASNGQGSNLYAMSVTALAGLAFLAHGEQPGRGLYGHVLERTIRWILKNQYVEGPAAGLYFDYDEDLLKQNDSRPMHGHGYATLFLAEAYGQSSDEDLRKKLHDSLVKAVRLIEKTQSDAGGWFYKPADMRDEGSVTITQIQALRAARNAGIQVNKTTVDRAVDYIRRSQFKEGDPRGPGGVRYTISYGDASPALTAAGIAVYYGAGEYGSPGIELGFQYLAKHMRIEDKTHFWYYTHLYAVQAMYHRGGPEWASYFPKLRRELLGARNTRGEWDDQIAGKYFASAVAVLCLEVPLQYLPIFQR